MIRPMHLSGIALAAVLAACGGAGGGYGTNPGTTGNPGNPTGGPPPLVKGNTVTLTDDNSFSPSNLGASPGATVTWKWGQCAGDGYSTCVSHNVTFDDGSHSETQSSGEFSRTFTAAGTYKYHCTIHGSGMSGQVVVQ